MAEPAEVRRYYDEWTGKYMETLGECIQANRPARQEELLEYLMTRAGLRDGQRVLDAGCGICGPARYFAAHRAVDIEAVTISPVQAEIAAARNAEAGLGGRIRVTVGDFHVLEEIYGREQFDIVYFLESLSHSTRPETVLESVYAVLKPGGIVYIKDYYMLRREDAEEQRRVREVIDRLDDTFSTATTFTADIEEALRRTGFLRRFAEKTQFTEDYELWLRFEQLHRVDLYRGQPKFDCWDWWELRYQKP